MSSVRLQSRLQSSMSNLPLIGQQQLQQLHLQQMPHSKRGLMHSPVRAPLRSLSIGRS
jgi:hypothetical protein